MHPRFYGYTFKNADKILVLSEDMKQSLLALGCSEEKLMAHHLGVDLQEFDGAVKEVDANTVNFLVVANFVPKKGIDLAIHAFYKLINNPENSGKQLTLKILGRGPEEAKLRKLVDDYSLQDKVVFVNNYQDRNPRAVVVAEMRNADVFLLPSATVADDYGGTPIVLMEASAMQLPVITTADAGNAEIVLHDQAGFLVEQNNMSQLAEAMQILVDQPLLRRQLGKKGRQYIEESFNQSKHVLGLEKIYEELKPK